MGSLPRGKVQLRKKYFGRIPRELRLGITASIPRLEKIRREIEETAKYRRMPEIILLDCALVHGESNVGGRQSFKRSGEFLSTVVELAGPAVLFSGDDMTLRSIIVHEYSHCFWYQTAIEVARRKGDSCIEMPEGPFASEDDADRAQMVRAEDWFSDEDAANFLFHNDGRMDQMTELVASSWIAKGLPTEDAQKQFDFSGNFKVDNGLIAHLEKIGAFS